MQKEVVIKTNNARVKLGKHGEWIRVETLLMYGDKSFDICLYQEWTCYGPETSIEINYKG